MKSLYLRINEAKTEEELRKLDKEILAIGRARGMHDFRPYQVAYLERMGDLKKKGC